MMTEMMKLYKNDYPNKDDLVVVSLAQLEEDNAHVCTLLEYGGVKGVICKVNIKKRDRTFKNLKVGSVFLIVVSNVTEKKKSTDITSIDLHYMEIDDDKIKSHLGRYQQYLNIVNAFTYIASDISSNFNIGNELTKQEIRKQRKLLKNSSKQISNEIVENIEEKPSVSFNYSDQDENVKARVKIIMEETLYKYPKEEIEKMFFKDTIELHNVASQWIECNKIPNFMEKLVIKFPKQKVNINMTLHCHTIKCNGIGYIKDFYNRLNQKILEYDDKATIDIAIQSMPICSIIIKSDLIVPSNCKLYFNIISQFIEDSCDRHMDIKILSCFSDTSTSIKTNLLHNDEIVNDEIINAEN
jgi:translation initiation factor 2 alpha subunit (eIF-2alpha)